MQVESRIRPKGTITLRGSFPGGQVSIRPGLNTYADDVWALMTDDLVVKFHLDNKNLIPQKVEPVEEPKKYKPLTPTISQLTPIPTIGKTTAASIVQATPEGGYESPEQIISINELSVPVEAVAALFE